jgi:hypothetical protein
MRDILVLVVTDPERNIKARIIAGPKDGVVLRLEDMHEGLEMIQSETSGFHGDMAYVIRFNGSAGFPILATKLD